MPAHQNELPEGTDHIINGAMETGRSSTASDAGGAEPETGVVGSGNMSDDTGGTAMTGNEASDGGVRGQLRQGVSNLKDQAGGRIRDFADDGKTRVSEALDEFSRIVEEAAESIEERLGGQYSPIARRAAETVSSLATTLRDRDVDELYDDARGFVRRSPALAVGVAAALGFVAVRLVKAGLPEEKESGDSEIATGKSGRSGKRRNGADA